MIGSGAIGAGPLAGAEREGIRAAASARAERGQSVPAPEREAAARADACEPVRPERG